MEPNFKNHSSKRCHSMTGIALILIGAIILAGNIGWIPAPIWDVLYSWPSIFLIIAFIDLLKQKIIPFLIFVLIWAAFTLPDILPDLNMEELKTYWPILLILVGLLFLNSHKKRHKLLKSKADKPGSDDIIEEVVVFSGNIRRIETDNFKGGEITSIFGGSEIYFNHSKIAPGGAVIELVNIFGGTKLIVPREWNVRIEVTSILGGFADKRFYAPNEPSSEQTLTIKGTTIFGGGEITNY